ncbi:T9SS type A sorting domain-containing protein [Candidatus Neomarinimicrobiota bacterium]
MRPYFKPFITLLITFSVLLSQEPAPICGLPQISQISPDTPVILHKASSVLTGDLRFKIRKDVTSGVAVFIEVDCYLKHTDTDFEIYVEVAEWDSGHVDMAAVDTIVTYFRDRTPPGSIDPDLGIKTIAEASFGPPPGASEQVYILLVDVRDNYVPGISETYVAGYFDPYDQTTTGNNADIIYLDTNPGKLAGGDIQPQIVTLAHEYQHLIHYGQDMNEATWIDEGLSELSPVLAGLPHREFTYYLSDTNQRLDSFDNTLADYARSGLFFLYSWVQLEGQIIRDLVARPENGIAAFETVLAAHGKPSFNDHVYNWHLANYLQVEGTYGYGEYESVPQPVMHDLITSFPEDVLNRQVERLGARWTLITGGRDLYLSASRYGGEPELTLLNGDARTVITAPQLLTTGFQDSTFGTAYSDMIVLASTSTAVMTTANYSLYAEAEGGYSEEILAYDGNEQPGDLLFITLGNALGNAGEAAVAFDVPADGGELSAVQFYTLGSDSVQIRLYRQALMSDSVIYAASISAPLANEWTTFRLPRGLLGGDQPVYVSITSVDNALAYNEHLTISHSYYRFPGTTSFPPLPSLTVNVDGESKKLIGNWSVRLSYLAPDTSELAIDTPLAMVPPAIGSFYPNPFNAVTSLDINPGHSVEIVLYNLLGHEVRRLTRQATSRASLLWDGRMNDGRDAPSGLYFAKVTAGDLVAFRKLVLIR